MRDGAMMGRELLKSNGTFKFKDFMHLINSVNPKKSLFVLGMLLSLVTSGASLVVPQLTKGLVDTSGLSKIDGKMVAVLVLAFLIQLGFGTIGGYILRYIGESSVKTLREKLWAHLLKLPVDYFDDHKSGESSSRLVNDTSVIKDLITSQFPNFVTGAIQLVGSMFILFFMDWKMASLMFAIIPVFVLILLPIGRIMSKLGRRLQAATADFNADASEKLSEVRLIKSSNGEEFEKNNWWKLYQQNF